MKASKGEVRIHNILSGHQVPFAEEVEFPDLKSTSGRNLRFDFGIYNADGTLDFLLEFQGEQHYRPSQKFGGKTGFRKQEYNDKLKRKYCLLHGIKLVIIPYWEEDRLSYERIMRAAGY